MYEPIKSAKKLQQEQAARKEYANKAYRNASFMAYELESYKGQRRFMACAIYSYETQTGTRKHMRHQLLASEEFTMSEFNNAEAAYARMNRLQEQAKLTLITGRSVGTVHMWQYPMLGLKSDI